MAKGDHERGERRIDEQMKQSQSYLTNLQSQLGGQYGGLSSLYTGGGFPQSGNIYGWGTTVPHYSPYGPIFSGNNTDVPVGPSGGYSGGGSVQGIIEQYQQGIDPKDPQAVEKLAQRLQQAGHNVEVNGDRIRFPGSYEGWVDVLRNKSYLQGGADNRAWAFQPFHSKEDQRRIGNPVGGSSSGGGFGVGGSGIIGRNLADYGNIMGRFAGFADTGGLSEADKANIRSRAVSPIRSIYSSARQGLDRQRSLQGGYSPGFTTGMARLSREQGQLASDATTNAEAAIAEMVQRGKLAGMGGMASMYGATPGLSNMFGNQTLQSMSQQLQAAGLQNQLSMGIMNNQLGLAAVPGNVDSFFNTIGGVGRAAGQVGGAIYPWVS